MFSHAQSLKADENLRGELLAAGEKHKDSTSLLMESCSLDVDLTGSDLSVSSKIGLKNNADIPAETFILTLNPGLKISRLSIEGEAGDYSRDSHLVIVRPAAPLPPGEGINLEIDYSGIPDETYCYLDIDSATLRKPSKLGLFRVPKKYVFLSRKYVHLTPESGWYPRAGIPLSHRFPGPVESQYSLYSLKVRLPEKLTAVSQGLAVLSESQGIKNYAFNPSSPLPQISLMAGPYEERSINVKDVEYRLLYLPGHDYFSKYFDAMGEELPKAITQLKDEFEVTLGLDYPYEQLALVEVPIHFFSHKRLWSAAEETVQPQIVSLPEMGTLCQGADFASMNRMMQRRGRRGGGAEISSAQIQTNLFRRFVSGNLLGTEAGRGMGRDDSASSVTASDVDAQYNLLPNYFTFTSTLASARWPILHSSLESWLQDRISAATFRYNRSGGLTEQEKTNRLLDGRSLTDLLADEDLEDDQLNDVILAKGKYLMSAIESRIQGDNFDKKLLSFMTEHKFSTITEEEFLQFLFAYREFELEPVMAAWYGETRVPGLHRRVHRIVYRQGRGKRAIQCHPASVQSCGE